MTTAGSYADVNGLSLYYELHGEGAPLLLLHGGTCSIELPSMEIPFFASEFQVIAVEQMGHGRTADAMDREFHYHDMAEDTVALMDQLQIDSAFVFGLSDGGMLGLDMAMHHPERVRKLAVTGSNFRTDGYIEGALNWLVTVTPEDFAGEFQGGLRATFARRPEPLARGFRAHPTHVVGRARLHARADGERQGPDARHRGRSGLDHC